MVRNRSAKGVLFPPANNQTESDVAREKWLEKATGSFVNPSAANHAHYRRLLELFWPIGHGLPGPHISESQIRAHMEPYRDPFRRLRELQGEEGFKSIVKQGVVYQLQSPEVSAKREPRTKPKAALWRQLKAGSDGACSNCARKEPEIKLTPDHRRPRSRGGTGDDLNWQPLCEQCNIQKSAACQNCERECGVCYWAFPENFSRLEVDDHYRSKIRETALKAKKSQNEILNDILHRHFRDY